MNPVHIICKKEDIAENVIMPGDPLRAKYIAENFLDNYKLVNTVRNMLIYTGFYKGKKVTVASSGMGIPSMAIYSYELYKFYNVKQIIRVGTCGVINDSIKVRNVILGTEAYSISTFNYAFSKNTDRLISSNSELNYKIINLNNNIKTGTIYTSDVFDVYADISHVIEKIPSNISPLVSEMEAFGLFYIARELNKKATCLVTVTDSKYEPNNYLSAEDRVDTLNDMILIALEASI